MPYMKYGDWYIPGYEIKFPTEQEAMEYMNKVGGSCKCEFGINGKYHYIVRYRQR